MLYTIRALLDMQQCIEYCKRIKDANIDFDLDIVMSSTLMIIALGYTEKLINLIKAST